MHNSNLQLSALVLDTYADSKLSKALILPIANGNLCQNIAKIHLKVREPNDSLLSRGTFERKALVDLRARLGVYIVSKSLSYKGAFPAMMTITMMVIREMNVRNLFWTI